MKAVKKVKKYKHVAVVKKVFITKPKGPPNVVSTIIDLIAVFEGPTKLSRIIGTSPSAVGMWRADKRIPQRWHYVLDREARRRGLLINPRLFGEKKLFPDEQKMLAA